MTRPLVIFHGGCMDGSCAALAAWLKFGEDAEYRPAQYGDPAPTDDEIRGRDVYVLDFSYPRAELQRMAESAREVVLLDHHRTAAADLLPLTESLRDVRRVPLSNGECAYVDECDLVNVSNYSWSKAQHGGAIAYAGGGRENAKMIYMHRLILDAADGINVDHANRNTVDNRRANLRLATKTQNAANMDRGSKWKGVTASREKWRAQITIAGENRHLGVFDDVEDAARCYDKAALEAFGEFALLNFDTRPKLMSANISITFDMSKSGAVLAWEHFNSPGFFKRNPPDVTVPELFAYVQDRDLWQWKLPHSREVSAALAASGALTDFRALVPIYEGWGTAASGWKRSLVDHGAAILRAECLMIERVVATAEEVEIEFESWSDGQSYTHESVRCLAATSAVLQSEVGEALALESARRGFDAVGAVYYRDGAAGKWRVSLRSLDVTTDDQNPNRINVGVHTVGHVAAPDVSAIAKSFGGGGHARAAGFECEQLPWVRS